MAVNENPESIRSRRAMLTGGAVGLVAVAGAAALRSAPPALAQTTASVTDWLNVVNYGADPTGINDSTSAINAALTAAAAQTAVKGTVKTGGVVYVPTGVYVTSAPLVVPAQVLLLGAFPASADMVSQPGAHNPPDYAGSIIQPASTWASPLKDDYVNPGVIYINGSGTNIHRPSICNIWVDGSNLTGTNAVAGLSAYGGAAHGIISGVGIYNMPTAGMSFTQDVTATATYRADGWTIRDCVVQTWGAASMSSNEYCGIYWEGDDTQFVNVHVQAYPKSTRGGSCWYVADGGNCRWVACRGDQSGDAGWTFDSNPGGSTDSPGTCNALIGCGTESNANSGLHLINTSVNGTATGGEMRTPIVAVGCAFGFDGRNNSTGGAGARVEGYNTLFLDNCVIGTSADGYPQYGLVTALSPVSAGQTGTPPALIRAFGGIWNCYNPSLVDDTADMIGAGTLWADVHYVGDGAWTTSTPIKHYVQPSSG
jgi:hypothetical protein